MRTVLTVQGIPLLVIQKMQRPILDLLRSYEVQVDLDVDVDAYAIYEEFKKYDELIGIYVFT